MITIQRAPRLDLRNAPTLYATRRRSSAFTSMESEGRDVFASTAPEEQASLLEKVVVIGATNVATAAEMTAADASRMRIEQSVERLEAAHEQLLEHHEE